MLIDTRRGIELFPFTIDVPLEIKIPFTTLIYDPQWFAGLRNAFIWVPGSLISRAGSWVLSYGAG